LFQKKIISLYVEGGSQLATNLIRENLVNRVSLYLNPSFLGAGPAAIADFGISSLNERPRLHHLKSEWLGDDLYLTGSLA
jgi:diaminohydroxyphosphoribosylaminopyrimidine deaminase / 5-amino-6-(5-phosphoribosylamino)uracil reductase